MTGGALPVSNYLERRVNRAAKVSAQYLSNFADSCERCTFGKWVERQRAEQRANHSRQSGNELIFNGLFRWVEEN
jgi:hypothetical protein